jgi:hypothetical protein
MPKEKVVVNHSIEVSNMCDGAILLEASTILYQG